MHSTHYRSVNHLNLETGKSQLDTAIIDRFNSLPYPADKILAEYVWVDAKGECRSKTRTLPVARGESVDKLPRWNFDGSSTDQAPGDDSEVILRPCRIFKDPFRPRDDGVSNILVMCDTYTPAGEALPSNTRAFGKGENGAYGILFFLFLRFQPNHQPPPLSMARRTRRSGSDSSRNSPFSTSIRSLLSDGPRAVSPTGPRDLTTARPDPRTRSDAL